MSAGGKKNTLEMCGVNLSTLGLGVEHFAKGVNKVKHLTSEENSSLILEEAFNFGITHYDLVFDLPYFFDTFGQFSKDKRDKITFTAHIGNVFNETKGKPINTRVLKNITHSFDRMMDKLDTDYADIALIQYVKDADDYDKIVKNGIVDYVNELKSEGRAKSIGISSHDPRLLLKIIEKEEFDVVMTILNFATGSWKATKKFVDTCKEKDIALIGIKSLLKGKLFTTKQTQIAAYYSAGKKRALQLDQAASPAQCLNYTLDLGANTAVFGVKTVEELQENVTSFRLEKKDDYNHIVKIFEGYEYLSS